MEDLALMAQQGDMQAYSQLYTDHERMIYKFVRKYSLGLESYEDLYSLGLVLFCEAVEKYDPNKGKFTTVLGSNLEFGFRGYKNRKKDYAVSIPPTWAERSSKLNSWVKEFSVKEGRFPTDEESMKFLNVDEQRYRDIRSVLKQDKTVDVSELLTVKAFDDTEGNATDKVFVNQLMNKYLNENEKKTIKLLFFDDMTHSEAAEVLGVSSSLIRNRKQRALHKMRKGLKVA